jgi:hypothetical protein
MRPVARFAALAAALVLFATDALAARIETKSILLELPPGWIEQAGPTISALSPTGARLMLTVVSPTNADAPLEQAEQAAIEALSRTVASPEFHMVSGPSQFRSPSGQTVTEARAQTIAGDYDIAVLVLRGERAVLLATIAAPRDTDGDLLAVRDAVVAVHWK